MSSEYQSIPQEEGSSSANAISNEVNRSSKKDRHSSTESIVSTDAERQPLVDRESGNHRYLSPDDPLVSPINLYKIRVLRVSLLTIFAINCVLFFAFLLSDFIAIPGLNNRGKSFLELDLVILNILTNLVTLWCFVVPAYYERVLGYISASLILIDFIIMFSIPRMRDQFGVIGTFVLLWTLANVVLNCFADFWVEKGKLYQERKYTGREETRKSISELFVIAVKVLFKLFLLWLIWCISLSLWLQAFDSHEKPWGKMIPVDNDQFKVHLACYGDVHAPPGDINATYNKEKQPIVLIEGGQLDSSEVVQEWVEELYHLGKIDRYCIWDRPGYGFSDSAPSPLSIGIVSEYLIEALRKERLEGPFSLVGFDIGGLYARMFASRSSGNIHSLLLVDSWHEDLLKIRPFSGSNMKNENKRVFKNILELMDTKTGLKLWLKGLVSPLGIVSNINWFFHPKRHSSNSRIFGSDMYYLSKYIRARLQEQVTASILSYNEMAGTDLHDIPVSVISSDFMIKNSLNWGKWQRSLTKLSDQTIEWVVAENSNHLIWRSPKGKAQLQQLLLRLVSEKSNY